MNAFNYIIDKREPAAAHKAVLEAILADSDAGSAADAHCTGQAPSSDRQIDDDDTTPRVIPLPHGMDGCVVLNALTRAECDALIAGCEGAGFTFWSDPAAGHEAEKVQTSSSAPSEMTAADGDVTRDSTTAAACADADERTAQRDLAQQGGKFRTCHTVEVNLPLTSHRLWQRVVRFVAPTVTITPDDEATFQRDLEGTWHASKFCDNVLFARYLSGGHFAPHVDGQSVVNFNRRSMYTALFYLNDCAAGGETMFYAAEDQCKVLVVDDATGRVTGNRDKALFKWAPRRGSCTIFRYDVLHEGTPVAPGHAKYIIRGDVEYERSPRVCDDERGRRAFAVYEEARRLEAEGDTDGAVNKFRAVRKLSPELAEILQIS